MAKYVCLPLTIIVTDIVDWTHWTVPLIGLQFISLPMCDCHWLFTGKVPDSKLHGAFIGPTWGRQDMLAPWTLLSKMLLRDNSSSRRCTITNSAQILMAGVQTACSWSIYACKLFGLFLEFSYITGDSLYIEPRNYLILKQGFSILDKEFPQSDQAVRNRSRVPNLARYGFAVTGFMSISKKYMLVKTRRITKNIPCLKYRAPSQYNICVWRFPC